MHIVERMSASNARASTAAGVAAPALAAAAAARVVPPSPLLVRRRRHSSCTALAAATTTSSSSSSSAAHIVPRPAPRAARPPAAAAAAAVPSASPAAAADPAADDAAADAAARDFAAALARVADDTKAQDVSVLHVAPLVSWTSYFVVATVVSRPQLLAVLARMEAEAEGAWGRQKRNSPGSSPWEVLDYGDGALGRGGQGWWRWWWCGKEMGATPMGMYGAYSAGARRQSIFSSTTAAITITVITT